MGQLTTHIASYMSAPRPHDPSFADPTNIEIPLRQLYYMYPHLTVCNGSCCYSTHSESCTIHQSFDLTEKSQIKELLESLSKPVKNGMPWDDVDTVFSVTCLDGGEEMCKVLKRTGERWWSESEEIVKREFEVRRAKLEALERLVLVLKRVASLKEVSLPDYRVEPEIRQFDAAIKDACMAWNGANAMLLSIYHEKRDSLISKHHSHTTTQQPGGVNLASERGALSPMSSIKLPAPVVHAPVTHPDAIILSASDTESPDDLSFSHISHLDGCADRCLRPPTRCLSAPGTVPPPSSRRNTLTKASCTQSSAALVETILFHYKRPENVYPGMSHLISLKLTLAEKAKWDELESSASFPDLDYYVWLWNKNRRVDAHVMDWMKAWQEEPRTAASLRRQKSRIMMRVKILLDRAIERNVFPPSEELVCEFKYTYDEWYKLGREVQANIDKEVERAVLDTTQERALGATVESTENEECVYMSSRSASDGGVGDSRSV